jgi:putative transposase
MMSTQVEAVAEAPGEDGVQMSTTVVSPVVDRRLVARLVGDARSQGVTIFGEGGLLAQLTTLVVESALEGELTGHLGYEKHERAEAGNARNGTRSKTVLTKAGPVQIEDVVLSLSARGMTHGDIAAHLADVYGSNVSKTTISTITDKVLDGMSQWQNRPLDPVFGRVHRRDPCKDPGWSGREPTDLRRSGRHQ